ncbi:MAG TPA: VIT domain-containing protein, partial [Kofleriaceae bacterium]|nr:VIT domain-containing protein [Kofleriaceae bacterium]
MKRASLLLVLSAAACGAHRPAPPVTGGRPAVDGAARVAGRVIDAAGVPVAGIAVMVGSAAARSMAITDEQGRFAVDNLRPGDWEIVVDPCQQDAAVRQVHVGRGQQVSTELRVGAPLVGSRVARLPTPSLAGGPASAAPAPPPTPTGAPPDDLLAAAGADEIWIIARPQTTSAGAARRRYASGLVCAYVPSAGRDLPLPLADTEVDATVRGWAAEVQVTQRYHNPHAETLEAVYVFSLPMGAAVSDFLATIGGRRIRGIVRDRDEAERIYAEARAAGYVAALLTQSRSSVFTQRLANVPPGQRIDLELTYHQVVNWADGSYRFAFPAPPPRRAAGPQPRFAMTVDIEAAAPIAAVLGDRVDVRRLSPTRRLVTVAPGARSAGEYAVGWKVSGEAGASLFVHPD